MLLIEGRRVYVTRGPKTQTVNVCAAENVQGTYAGVYRLAGPPFVAESEVAAHPTLDALRTWLLASGFRDEGPRPPRPIDAPVIAGVAAPVLGEPFVASAARVVETAIDSLLWEFVEHPYLHRVEHSLHARLFGILAAHPQFAHVLPIGRTGSYTQPVHKEWPETVSRPGKDGRRGNFDLAVLHRDQLASVTLADFRSGRIAAAIVIEMGLDYDLRHLADDHDKLVNSKVAAGYLVHFARGRPRDPAVEAYLLDPAREYRTAYAHHDPSGVCTFKTIAGDGLRTSRPSTSTALTTSAPSPGR